MPIIEDYGDAIGIGYAFVLGVALGHFIEPLLLFIAAAVVCVLSAHLIASLLMVIAGVEE